MTDEYEYKFEPGDVVTHFGENCYVIRVDEVKDVGGRKYIAGVCIYHTRKEYKWLHNISYKRKEITNILLKYD